MNPFVLACTSINQQLSVQRSLWGGEGVLCSPKPEWHFRSFRKMLRILGRISQLQLNMKDGCDLTRFNGSFSRQFNQFPLEAGELENMKNRKIETMCSFFRAIPAFAECSHLSLKTERTTPTDLFAFSPENRTGTNGKTDRLLTHKTTAYRGIA